jgi:ribose transport system ATP-binding protein
VLEQEVADGASVARLSIRNLSKHFRGSTALDGVNLTIREGEIHALVGQNGSGKSTLIKVLAGYHSPEPAAKVDVDGSPLHLPPRPSDLRAAGVSFVHQDLGLIDHFTVAENISVGHFETSGPFRRISWTKQNRIAADVLNRLGVDIPPTALVATLPPSQRAIVAIARGLLSQTQGRGVIILDEATRALPKGSLDDVHDVLKRIKADGGSVLMISHNLEEVITVADRVTVLRDGHVMFAGEPTEGLSSGDIAREMLGYELESAVHSGADRAVKRAEVLRVKAVSGPTATDVSFNVGGGEIVGITGLAGSGFEELPYLLTGATHCHSGEIDVGDVTLDASVLTVGRALAAGLALVPERREHEGLAFEMTVADNLTLPRLRSKGRPWFVGNSWRRQETTRTITQLGVIPAHPEALVRELSGGNQQKVLLGKWLAGEPKVLLLHEPTQAVDVGARHDILASIVALAATGVAIVIASLEAADLSAICDRVLIFKEGSPVATLEGASSDEIIDSIYLASAMDSTDPK